MTSVSSAWERPIDRVRSAPLFVHGIALLFVLLALVPVVGTSASYSADEGAAILQARSLADGDGWIVPHPLPEVDPDDELYPLELSSSGPKGIAPYAKHPLFPVVLAGVDRVGGHTAMVVVSVLGTWVASLGAAVLARALFGAHERSALWLAGVGTPLLFNAYWVIAHSVAAAASVWSVILVVRCLDRRWAWWVAPAASALMAIASLLRTEAAIFALSVGLGCLVVGALRRRAPLLVTGGAVGMAGLGARRLDQWWLERIVGEPASGTAAFVPSTSSGGITDRIDGFLNTWMIPGPTGDKSLAAVTVFVGVALIAVGALALRRHAPSGGAVFVVAGGGLLVLRAVAMPVGTIPGLIMAFPLLLVAAIGVKASADLSGLAARFVIGVLAVAWGGVLLTQYAEGGVGDWGGRYFLLGVPLVAPFVARVAARAPAGLSRAPRIALTGALVAGTLATSGLAIRELRAVHQRTDTVLDAVAELAASLGPEPVIVTDVAPLPRLDWRGVEHRRWLLADPGEHPDLPARLARAGHDQWVLVSEDLDAALRSFNSVRRVRRVLPGVALVEYSDHVL